MTILVFLLSFALAADGPAAEDDRASAYREFLLARLAGATGDLGGAAGHLDQAMELDPGAAEIRASRAMLALRLGRVSEAIDRARAAAEADPDNALAWDVLSRAWAQHHRLRGEGIHESVSAQREVVRLRPDDPDVKLALARRLLGGGDLDEAATALDGAWAQGGRPRALEMQLMEAYLRAGRPEAGLARIGRVIDTLGSAPASGLALYRSLVDRGYGSHADEVLVALAERTPPDPRLELEVIRVLLGAGRVDDAAVLAERAMERWSHPRLGIVAGHALASSGKLTEAEAAYRVATETAPEDPLAWRELARLVARRGEDADAADLLLRGADVVAGTAGRAAAGLRLEAAERLLDAGRPADALELLGTIPSFGGALYSRERARALALAITEGMEAAAEPLSRIRSLEGLPPGAALFAEAQARVGALGEDATVSWLEGRIAADPSDGVAVQAARFWSSRGDYDRSLDVLHRARTRHPDSVEVLVELGGTLDVVGRDDEAVEVLRQAVVRAPDHGRALNNLAYLLALGPGPFDEAVALARRAVATGPENASFLDTLGWALHRAGRTEEARDPLVRAAGSGGGDDPVIREHLGDVLSALGSSRQAAENYRRALGLGPEDPRRIQAKLESVTSAPEGGS